MNAPLLLSLFVFLAACTGRPPADATGEEVYQQVCATCHGADLEGGVGPALSAGSNAAEQDDEFLRLTISEGRGRMPSFKSTLSAEQIDRAIDYLRERHG